MNREESYLVPAFVMFMEVLRSWFDIIDKSTYLRCSDCVQAPPTFSAARDLCVGL